MRPITTRLAALAAAALTASVSLPDATAFAAPPAESGNQNSESRHRTITSSETYMPLPPLTATVQANHRARGLIQIEVGLEISSPRLRQRVERFMPRLRNAHVQALTMYTGMNYRFGDIPDADRIAQMLQDATDATLGEEGAEILIGMIIIHAG